jgi:hypothetical protein
MTPERNGNEAPETPLQSEETRNAILAKTAAGRNTASGQARDAYLAEDQGDERPDTPEGSEIPIVGGEPQPDHPGEGAKPNIGAQNAPANLASNGSLPVNHVASPTGLIPVSAVTSDPHQGARLVQENLDETEKHLLRSGKPRLSRAKIESMSAHDLRAVAYDRGYDIGEYAGARTTRTRFLQAQHDDEGVTTDDQGGEIAGGAQDEGQA